MRNPSYSQHYKERYRKGADSRNIDIMREKRNQRNAKKPVTQNLGVNSIIRNYIIDNEFDVSPEEIIAYMKTETVYKTQKPDYFIGIIDSIRTDFIKKQEQIIMYMRDNLSDEEMLKKLQKGKKTKTPIKPEEEILIEQLTQEKKRLISYIVEHKFEISQEELLEYMQGQVPKFRRDIIPLLVNYIMEQLMETQDAILEKMKQNNYDKKIIESIQNQRQLLSAEIVRDIINQIEEEKRKQQGQGTEGDR